VGSLALARPQPHLRRKPHPGSLRSPTLPTRGRVKAVPYRVSRALQLSPAKSLTGQISSLKSPCSPQPTLRRPCCLSGAGFAGLSFPLGTTEGGGAPKGVQPVCRALRARAPNDGGRHASRRSTAAFSSRRRAPLSRPGRTSSWGSASSWRGPVSSPEGSPDAARVQGCESCPRVPHRPNAEDFSPAGPRVPGLSSPSPGLSRQHDAS
jgi:hypothetical protein